MPSMRAELSKKKRKLAGPPGGSAPGKRRKVNPSSQSAAGSSRRPVPVDSLKWRSVEVPEMFDDAEGFFGLEEVSGVDVVRDGDTIQFVAAVSPTDDDDDEFGGFEDLPGAVEEAGPADGSSPSKQSPERASQTKQEKKGTKKEAKESKKEAKEAKEEAPKKKGTRSASAEPAEDSELGNGGFETLQDLSGDEEETDVSSWVPLELSPPILSCLSRLKFSSPTAIQSAAIPEILAGHDVIGKASTGSGKTLAFAIPIVQKWLVVSKDGTSPPGVPIALVMSPTRELAHQITNHIKDLCFDLPTAPYVCSVTGGLSVHKQQRQLEKADIVVGTPGRLWEVLSSSTKLLDSFRAIKFLVVDEADRLLSEGHFKEAEEILKALDRNETEEDEAAPELSARQTLVFSATFNRGLQQKLAGKGRYDLADQAQSMEYLLKRLNFREEEPKFLDVNPVSQMAAGLKEGLVECGAMEKDLYLYALLMLQSTRRTLVFTNSISSVRRLAPMLQNLNIPALPLHSQMPQKARLRSVERFTEAKGDRASVLIATDVAARGLDIPGIDVVVHYHVPRTADYYVHRSGRTARAEHSGLSVLLCAPEEVVPTRRLIAKIHAAAAAKAGKKKSDAGGFFIRNIDIDRRLVNRLKERLVLAKKIADSSLAKEKVSKDEQWMREAAEELGVEYDSEEGVDNLGSWSGRGSGRKSKEKEARGLSKAEVASMRAQLKELLSKRVNTGVSEKYITGGRVDVDELLRGVKGEFLGKVDGLEIDSL